VVEAKDIYITIKAKQCRLDLLPMQDTRQAARDRSRRAEDLRSEEAWWISQKKTFAPQAKLRPSSTSHKK
jgi:hypothetical protein